MTRNGGDSDVEVDSDDKDFIAVFQKTLRADGAVGKCG